MLLRLIFLRIKFNLVSFEELVLRIVQAFLVKIFLFFIVIVVSLLFIDFRASGVDVLIVLVFFIVSIHSTLEELLLVRAHLRSRGQVLLRTSWRLFLLNTSICILTRFLSR